MKQVIFINKEKEQDEKPVEFTYCYGGVGFKKTTMLSSDKDIEQIVYLGECHACGDMFAVYFKQGTIATFTGHLNSGKY